MSENVRVILALAAASLLILGLVGDARARTRIGQELSLLLAGCAGGWLSVELVRLLSS